MTGSAVVVDCIVPVEDASCLSGRYMHRQHSQTPVDKAPEAVLEELGGQQAQVGPAARGSPGRPLSHRMLKNDRSASVRLPSEPEAVPVLEELPKWGLLREILGEVQAERARLAASDAEPEREAAAAPVLVVARESHTCSQLAKACGLLSLNRNCTSKSFCF